MQTLLGIAEPSRANRIVYFSNKGSTQAAVSWRECDTERFSTFSSGGGKRGEGAILCHWSSASCKAPRSQGREALLHLCVGVNGCAPCDHADSSSFSYSEVPADDQSPRVHISLSSAVVSWKCYLLERCWTRLAPGVCQGQVAVRVKGGGGLQGEGLAGEFWSPFLPHSIPLYISSAG